MSGLEVVFNLKLDQFIKIDERNEEAIFEAFKKITIEFFKFRNITLTKDNHEVILSTLMKMLKRNSYFTFDCIIKGIRSIPVTENNLSAATIEHYILQRYRSSDHAEFIKSAEHNKIKQLPEKTPFTEDELYKIGIDRMNSIKEFYQMKGVIMMTFSDELFETLLKRGYFSKYTTKEATEEITKITIKSIRKELESKILVNFDRQTKSELEVFESVIKNHYPNHSKITEKYPKYKVELRRNLLKMMFDDSK